MLGYIHVTLGAKSASGRGNSMFKGPRDEDVVCVCVCGGDIQKPAQLVPNAGGRECHRTRDCSSRLEPKSRDLNETLVTGGRRSDFIRELQTKHCEGFGER